MLGRNNVEIDCHCFVFLVIQVEDRHAIENSGTDSGDECAEGQAYRIAETPRGSRGVSYSDVPTTVTVDFLVVDLEGTAVVVPAAISPAAS